MAALLAFLTVAYVIGRLIYWLVIDREVPGGWEKRFGLVEPLPVDVGQWKRDEQSEDARAALAQGLKREVRLFHDARSGSLVRQVRYRDATTNAIARVDADVPVRRRRVRSSG